MPFEPEGGFMSRRELIDPEVREPLDQLLEVMPGGFNSIPDIVQRRDAVAQLLGGRPARCPGSTSSTAAA